MAVRGSTHPTYHPQAGDGGGPDCQLGKSVALLACYLLIL